MKTEPSSLDTGDLASLDMRRRFAAAGLDFGDLCQNLEARLPAELPSGVPLERVAICVSPEAVDIMTRSALVRWLRANGLSKWAKRVERLVLPPGHGIVIVIGERLYSGTLDLAALLRGEPPPSSLGAS